MLTGLTVLDLTQFLSGPFATQILGDLGADVIKIEWGHGDLARKLPPYFVDGDSLYFLAVNRNKRSVCINLKHPEGREAFLRLAQRADVLIENFRPGVLERLGLDEATLRSVNPNLILCSITGYGREGPLADRPAYDMIIQAASGGMSMTGEPGGRPVRAGIPIADLAAGLYAAIGILARLAAHGRGGSTQQRIDVSMLDCQIAMLSYQGAYALFSGEEPGLQGRGHRSIPTYTSFQCADGAEVLICANTERMWEGLVEALDLPELLDDPRFATNEDRLRSAAELHELLARRFAELDAEEALARLQTRDVPATRVNGVLDALSLEQVGLRNMVLELARPSGERYRVPGDPLKLGSRAPTAAPALGEHTDIVLRSAGYTAQELERLRRLEAIA